MHDTLTSKIHHSETTEALQSRNRVAYALTPTLEQSNNNRPAVSVTRI